MAEGGGGGCCFPAWHILNEGLDLALFGENTKVSFIIACTGGDTPLHAQLEKRSIHASHVLKMVGKALPLGGDVSGTT